MDAELERMVRELHDKQAIREVIMNYARGVDRQDKALLVSCYHPDALDDHGMFVGGAEDFFDWTEPSHLGFFVAHHHILTNHVCTLDGDVAHTETYYMFAGRLPGEPPQLSLNGGRYIDRLEKREGRWAIVARKCVVEWWGTPADMSTPETQAAFAAVGKTAKDKSDLSYDRPLTVDPKRVGVRMGI
jgi:hypothetical protein